MLQIALPHLGVIHIAGADATTFLQGQVSNDMRGLATRPGMLAGFHNPQGRAVALLRLAAWQPGEILAVLPRELAPEVVGRLAKFVLRAKVSVADVSHLWSLFGLVADATDAAPASQDSRFLPVGDQPRRWLAVCPVGSSSIAASDHESASVQTWQRLEVASGEPQVVAATCGEFVAQMLNLDLLGGIAFDKGCYTGQEVIARAHYRGRMKRRMQRFVTRERCVLQPGDAGQLGDGRAFKVVRAAPLDDGRCDFLAVAALEPGEADKAAARHENDPPPLMPAVVAAPTAAAAAALSHPPAVALAVDPAPLPYSLPD